MDLDRTWKEFAWYPPELEPSVGGGREEQANDRAPVGCRVGETSDSQERPKADWIGDPKASETLPSPPGSAKKTRVPNGSQTITCLVDGCIFNFSDCREYYRRHRVCEQHSKTPIVVVGGKQQRFCQQCSRFHALGEFDEVKRSCRKRLDGHNRRRRKPQLSSLFMAGSRILQFNDPEIYATLHVRNAWPDFAKNESRSKMYDHQQQWHIDQQVPPSSLTDMKRGQDDTISCHGNRAASGVSLYTNKALSGTAVSPESGQGSQRLCDATTRSIDSGFVLYLLSSSSNTTPTSELSLVQSSMVHPEQAQCLEQHFEAADKHLSSRGDKDNNHYNGLHHAGLNDLVESGDLLTLPFLWE